MLTCCCVPRSLLLLLLAESCTAGVFLWLVWLHSCHGMPHVIRIGEQPRVGRAVAASGWVLVRCKLITTGDGCRVLKWLERQLSSSPTPLRLGGGRGLSRLPLACNPLYFSPPPHTFGGREGPIQCFAPEAVVGGFTLVIGLRIVCHKLGGGSRERERKDHFSTTILTPVSFAVRMERKVCGWGYRVLFLY